MKPSRKNYVFPHYISSINTSLVLTLSSLRCSLWDVETKGKAAVSGREEASRNAISSSGPPRYIVHTCAGTRHVLFLQDGWLRTCALSHCLDRKFFPSRNGLFTCDPPCFGNSTSQTVRWFLIQSRSQGTTL